MQGNPEWTLVSFTAGTQSEASINNEEIVTMKKYYGEEYSAVIWTLKIQRRPNYYVTVVG
jgi:hypothetical protein